MEGRKKKRIFYSFDAVPVVARDPALPLTSHACKKRFLPFASLPSHHRDSEDDVAECINEGHGGKDIGANKSEAVASPTPLSFCMFSGKGADLQTSWALKG